jgi:hypothetical protein
MPRMDQTQIQTDEDRPIPTQYDREGRPQMEDSILGSAPPDPNPPRSQQTRTAMGQVQSP